MCKRCFYRMVLVGVLGFASGAVVGYLTPKIVKKFQDKKSQGGISDEGLDPNVATNPPHGEHWVSRYSPEKPSLEEMANKMTNLSTEELPDDIPESTDVMDADEEEEEEDDDEDIDLGLDPDKEPYVITEDEFLYDKWLGKDHLNYFEDGVIADDLGHIIDRDDIGEDNLDHFSDDGVLFVRNEKLELDWEISLTDGDYFDMFGDGSENYDSKTKPPKKGKKVNDEEDDD